MRSPGRSLLLSLVATALGVQLLAPPTVLAPAEGPAPEALGLVTQRGGKKKRAAKAFVDLEPFVGDLAAARALARERNAPLLLHVVLEGEPQNDEYRDQLLPDRDLIAVSHGAVVVITNNGDHGRARVKEEVEGETVRREVCAKYRWFSSCADHRAAWDSAYNELANEEGELRCPQTLIELPGGKAHWRYNDGNPPATKEVIAQLEAAQQAAGPGLTNEGLRRVRSLRKSARHAQDGKLWGEAWRDWAGVRELIAGGTYGEEAATALAEVEAAMDAELASFEARLVPGSAAEAYGDLVELAKGWSTTSREAQVRRLMKRAEKDKAIKEEVARKQLELEAEGLYAEYEALVREGDEKAAKKVLKKLQRKKYADTPAGKRAREV